MGRLIYDDAADPIPIDDLTLSHLKVVIAAKLRRNESFTLSWQHPDGDGVGRSTVWIHPAIPLRFDFDEAEAPKLRPEWIAAIADSANATGGISVITSDMLPEPPNRTDGV